MGVLEQEDQWEQIDKEGKTARLVLLLNKQQAENVFENICLHFHFCVSSTQTTCALMIILCLLPFNV